MKSADVTEQGQLFENVTMQVPRQPQVDFLAGLFATWQMPGRKPTKKERDVLDGLARDALIRLQQEGSSCMIR